MDSLFRPVSGCGVGCLPRDPGPGIGRVRRTVRAVRTMTILGGTATAGTIVALLPGSVRGRAARSLLRHSSRAILRSLGVRVAAGGVPLPAERALVVANHVSWMDILVLLAVTDVRMVAKSEVATWPIIGPLARLAGTIFIDRARPRSLPSTVAEVREVLAAGGVVAVFAEGTTACGTHRMGFRPALFQAAIDAGTRVVPVSLRYRLPAGDPTVLPAFIGDETLVESMRRVLSMRAIRLDLRSGAPLYPNFGTSRRLLARAAASAAPVAADRPMPVAADRPMPAAADRPKRLRLAGRGWPVDHEVSCTLDGVSAY